MFVKDSLLFGGGKKAKGAPVTTAKKPKSAKTSKKTLTNIMVHGLDFSGTDVVIYFSGTVNNLYQIYQWIEPFKELNRHHKIVFVFRDEAAYKEFVKEHNFQAVYLRLLDNLNNFYRMNDFKAILYVNNAVKNFQSLIFNGAFHIHINHGESEKESMYSNQAKAYDFVFTVGDRAVDRYREHLMRLDENKFVKVGRPQLDFVSPYPLENPEGKRVILYAPTWEATHETMNYTSIARYGELLIKLLVMSKKYLVIYKPHSSAGTRDKKVAEADRSIRKELESYEDGYVLDDQNIVDLFPVVDFALFDNTSVMIDYLHFDKPGAYIEIKNDEALRYLEKAFVKINDDNIADILAIIEKELIQDSFSEERRSIKEYYLGNYKEGESTRKFVSTVSDIIDERNREIEHIMVDRVDL